jgi:hypothetical protein
MLQKLVLKCALYTDFSGYEPLSGSFELENETSTIEEETP